MSLLPTIRQILDSRGVVYKELNSPRGKSLAQTPAALGITADRVAVATPVADDSGTLLAIHTADRTVDLAAFNREQRRKLVPLSGEQVAARFPRCEDGACVPLAELHGVGALIDERLANQKVVCFLVEPDTVIALRGEDFNLLQGPAWYDSTFTRPATDADDVDDAGEDGERQAQALREAMQAVLADVSKLPAMPGIAQQLLQLSVNPYANASDLGAVVEQDPSLTAQLIRYANSPLYNYRGDVDSVRDAIARVLGFDMVLDMTLGIAVGRALRMPRKGPLGLDAFWQHSLYCAALVQRLAGSLAADRRPRPGMAYLAGLLHNFGFLVLGHLFPQQYALLRDAWEREPQASLPDLESRVLGVSHQQIGVWLMENWGMAEEVLTAIREHHSESYRGRHAIYPNLVLIANRLLKTLSLGDEPGTDLPADLLWALGLSEDEVRYVFDSVLENREGLDFMALQMAA